jgi:hypothetical protein
MTSKRTPSKAENFKLITGISRSIERRLHEAGIATYAKLSLLTPQGISTILGDANGVTTKRIIKDRWIEQARDLSSRPGVAESAEETVGRDDLPSVESQGLASFVVELLQDEKGHTKRTRVLHVGCEPEETWSGWQERRLLDYFITHAGLCLPAPDADVPTVAPVEQSPEAIAAPITIADPVPSSESPNEASQQAVEIVTSTGRTTFQESRLTPVQGRIASRIIVANHSFEVRLALDLSEIGSSHRKTLNYNASIYAKSLKDPLHQSVGEADGKLKPTDTAIIVSCNPLPQGVYRLQATVGLSNTTTPPAHRISPILQTGEKLLRFT